MYLKYWKEYLNHASLPHMTLFLLWSRDSEFQTWVLRTGVFQEDCSGWGGTVPSRVSLARVWYCRSVWALPWETQRPLPSSASLLDEVRVLWNRAFDKVVLSLPLSTKWLFSLSLKPFLPLVGDPEYFLAVDREMDGKTDIFKNHNLLAHVLTSKPYELVLLS